MILKMRLMTSTVLLKLMIANEMMTGESMVEKLRPRKLYVTFFLKGKFLNPQAVTDRLGIKPSKSFARGDVRSGDKKWPHGYWALESSDFVDSTDPANHFEWLMNKLEMVEKELIKLLEEDTSFIAKVSCFWIMSNEHASFTLSDKLLVTAVRLKLKIDFDIYRS